MSIRAAALTVLAATLLALPAQAAIGHAPIRGREVAVELPQSSAIVTGGVGMQQQVAFGRVGVMLPVPAEGVAVAVGPRVAVGVDVADGAMVPRQSVGVGLLLTLAEDINLRVDLESSFRPDSPSELPGGAFGVRLELLSF